ncbi:hypothetical protein ANN_18047 [Periplaneta americana]|uniref:Uncharacterized protein n=1 Tax=Periplaneta americana TaxID=6978 RepID=A0ABQ8SMP0_PERAM|nr:hypothetical protein ANN_18047 [Periplaneta americana]
MAGLCEGGNEPSGSLKASEPEARSEKNFEQNLTQATRPDRESKPGPLGSELDSVTPQPQRCTYHRCVELEQVRRKYLPPSMLSQNRSSLACLDLMGNREYEQKTGLFLLKSRQIRSPAVERAKKREHRAKKREQRAKNREQRAKKTEQSKEKRTESKEERTESKEERTESKEERTESKEERTESKEERAEQRGDNRE